MIKTIICLSFSFFLLVSPLYTQWLTNGNVVCNASQLQSDIHSISDGEGGAIIVWKDERSDRGNIYAQRIDANGHVQWATNGIAVCNAVTMQTYPRIVPVVNPAGGVDAFIMWEDHRGTTDDDSLVDIYAQRISSNGSVLWSTNGARVTSSPTALSDGYSTDDEFHTGCQLSTTTSGDLVIVWIDATGTNFYDTVQTSPRVDIVAQKLTGFTGEKIWNTPAIVSGTAPGMKLQPQILAIGDECFCAWVDFRNNASKDWNKPSDIDVYYQRLSSSGNTLYASGGVNVTTNSFYQILPVLLPDASDGVILCWGDITSTKDRKLYAQHISAAGSPLWTPSSGVIVVDKYKFDNTALTIDGRGGMVVTYIGNGGLQVQRIDNKGQCLFGPNGVLALSAPRSKQAVIVDTTYGIYVAVAADRAPYDTLWANDMYVQRLSLTTGSAIWQADGVPVSLAMFDQTNPSVVLSKNGGLLVSFMDDRSGKPGSDITANFISSTGQALADVKMIPDAISVDVILEQNFPNPFAETTTIRFSLPHSETLSLTLYDQLCRVVYRSPQSQYSAGTSEVSIKLKSLPAGVYSYRLTTSKGYSVVQKMIIR